MKIYFLFIIIVFKTISLATAADSVQEPFKPTYINTIFELEIDPAGGDAKLYKVSRHPPYMISVVRIVARMEEEAISDKSIRVRVYNEPVDESIFSISNSEHKKLEVMAKELFVDFPLTDDAHIFDGEAWTLWSNIYQTIRIKVSDPTYDTSRRGYIKLVSFKKAIEELEDKYIHE